VADAALEGFRIVGDAATPLGTGVMARDSVLSISQVEITGAANAAIDVGRGSQVRIVAADIRDNPGSGLAVRSGASAAIAHSLFARNGTAGSARKTLTIEDQGAAQFRENVFVGAAPGLLTGSSDARTAFARDNWFVAARTTAAGAARPAPRGR
jgi:hypothetical protein